MYRLLSWKWQLAAPLMGMLLTLSFAPYDFAYVALPALMFLYRAWSMQSPRWAAVTGYFFGLGLFGSGIWWVYVSMHDYGGADTLSAG
ncbi:MAG: apolipoprotein N-acyltransferase, partial [Methylomonas sp.]